jgi:KaiC/GvpD/RAD55 family RecA-like ATPase
MSRQSTLRQSTGIARLDEMLGGGLIPGTLTVVVGATGIGKTQLGLQFAHAGLSAEGRRGIVFDVSARGDSQNHEEYARRMFEWVMTPALVNHRPVLADVFDFERSPGDFLHVFQRAGRRVSRSQLDADQWHQWQADLNARLALTIAFFYGNFVRGVRRCVIDGVEPVDRPGDSIQLELFEYIYHQVLRKESEWVARDLFREQYRAHAEAVARHGYNCTEIGCLFLCTSHAATLDQLIDRPLDEGDVLSGANTIIYLGRVREGGEVRRALHIAKHRGSWCDDAIRPYRISDAGLQFD